MTGDVAEDDSAVEIGVVVEDGAELSEAIGGSTLPDCPLSVETDAGGSELPEFSSVPDGTLSETGGST